jgi:hypothetical protein
MAMNKLALLATTLLIFAAVSLGRPKPADTHSGEIMDSACAKAGNHDAGYKMSSTNTPKDCTLACVKGGSTLVLYDAATKNTYQLDDQTKAKEYAGQKVKVTGTYNSATKTIHVDKIQAAS